MSARLLASSFIRKCFLPRSRGKKGGRRRGAMLLLHAAAGEQVGLCVTRPRIADPPPSQPISETLSRNTTASEICATLRKLGLRSADFTRCVVVVPSEEVLLMVEEFPTQDPTELRAMAESRLHAFMELEPGGHAVSCAPLCRHGDATVCALAIFHRERIGPLLEFARRAGFPHPRWIVDAMADIPDDGIHGCVVASDDSPRVRVHAWNVAQGVPRSFHQRVHHVEGDVHEWAREMAGEFRVVRDARGLCGPPSELAGRVLDGRMADFELAPEFWMRRLREDGRAARRRVGMALAAAFYIGGLLWLAGMSLWQWREGTRVREEIRSQEPAFLEATALRKRLARAQASSDPAGQVLELMRQAGEPLPEGVTLDGFSYQFQNSLKLRGTAPESAAVYDWIGKLRESRVFHDARVESVGADGAGRGVTWQVLVPLRVGDAS